MPIAFFDLDRTLLSVNSGTLWVRRELALGHISKRQAVKAMVWLARYQLGFASGEAMVAEAVRFIEGVPGGELASRTKIFYENEVRGSLRPGAVEMVERHRARGDRLVMLTSSTHYLAELVGAELQFDSLLANRLHVGPDGLHTGRIDGRVCFGEGKLAHARVEAEKVGASLAEASFYTDSYSDLPVLAVVYAGRGEPRPAAASPRPSARLGRRRLGRTSRARRLIDLEAAGFWRRFWPCSSASRSRSSSLENRRLIRASICSRR